MSSALPAVELLPRPSTGRVFTLSSKIRLGDVDEHGRLRLDATARLLQDVAGDDTTDAALQRDVSWVVRRTMIRTTQPARLGERVDVATWCTGLGRAWAERRSQIVGERGALVDSVSLWVQVDPTTAKPARVADDFTETYGDAAAGRTVSARLSLPPMDRSSAPVNWSVRRTDIDPFGHVNNAATWSMLEEAALVGDRIGTGEVEYLQPVVHSTPVTVTAAHSVGLTDVWAVQNDVVCTAARWAPAS